MILRRRRTEVQAKTLDIERPGMKKRRRKEENDKWKWYKEIIKHNSEKEERQKGPPVPPSMYTTVRCSSIFVYTRQYQDNTE